MYNNCDDGDRWVRKAQKAQKRIKNYLSLGPIKYHGYNSQNSQMSTVKRPQNAYMFYCEDAFGKMSFAERRLAAVVEITNNWKKMTEAQKAPYEEMARLDQERYAAEKAIEEEEDDEDLLVRD